jgi:hypothetical protein
MICCYCCSVCCLRVLLLALVHGGRHDVVVVAEDVERVVLLLDLPEPVDAGGEQHARAGLVAGAVGVVSGAERQHRVAHSIGPLQGLRPAHALRVVLADDADGPVALPLVLTEGAVAEVVGDGAACPQGKEADGAVIQTGSADGLLDVLKGGLHETGRSRLRDERPLVVVSRRGEHIQSSLQRQVRI